MAVTYFQYRKNSCTRCTFIIQYNTTPSLEAILIQIQNNKKVSDAVNAKAADVDASKQPDTEAGVTKVVHPAGEAMKVEETEQEDFLKSIQSMMSDPGHIRNFDGISYGNALGEDSLLPLIDPNTGLIIGNAETAVSEN